MPNQPKYQATYSDGTVAGFAKLSTPEISDALDALGLPGSALEIVPIAVGNPNGRSCIHHPLCTGRSRPRHSRRLYRRRSGWGCYRPGQFGPNRLYRLGNILTEVATKRGIAGTVINGVCRDTPVIRSYEYPLFSRGSFMRTGKDRVQVSDMGVPVSLSDVRVRPGDILVGDDDGVVVIPHERETEILALAQKIADAENHIVDAVRGRARLDETRKALGYHLLQRT